MPEHIRTTSYVVGFPFTADGSRVVLIEKNRPAWQAGKLNGLGGKIEQGETPADAMARETEEESGLRDLSWEAVAVLNGGGFEIHFFAAFSDAVAAFQQREDERIVMRAVADLFELPVVPNLRVLIPLALDRSGIVKPVLLTDSVPAAA